MKVLAIESSCDETGAAVVDASGRVWSDVVASQVEEHAPYGGVVPEVAARSHMRSIDSVVGKALSDAQVELKALSGIAVTQGPGLVGALLVGLQFAKSLSLATGLPLVGVDHLHAHLLAIFLQRSDEADGVVPLFPFVGLLVSGGHTSLYRVEGYDRFEILGTTRDDAAGEAFDKSAKLLGLPYPGGPIVDALAEKGDSQAVDFPVPMKGRKGLDFSFSGLKTAVAQYVQRFGRPSSEQALADVCASFQRCVVEALLNRAFRACEETEIDQLVLAGGVAANRGLRSAAAAQGQAQGVSVFWPSLRSCTDNAAMIGYLGALRLQAGHRDVLSLEAYSRAAGFRKGKIRGERAETKKRERP